VQTWCNLGCNCACSGQRRDSTYLRGTLSLQLQAREQPLGRFLWPTDARLPRSNPAIEHIFQTVVAVERRLRLLTSMSDIEILRQLAVFTFLLVLGIAFCRSRPFDP